MWDYKWLEAQKVKGEVEGLKDYRELQLIVLVTRFLAWGTTKWINDAIISMWTNAFIGVISLIVHTLTNSANLGTDLVSRGLKGSSAT
jgi:hypothetical protein